MESPITDLWHSQEGAAGAAQGQHNSQYAAWMGPALLPPVPLQQDCTVTVLRPGKSRADEDQAHILPSKHPRALLTALTAAPHQNTSCGGAGNLHPQPRSRSPNYQRAKKASLGLFTPKKSVFVARCFTGRRQVQPPHAEAFWLLWFVHAAAS